MQLDAFVAFPVVGKQASFTGQGSTSDDVELGRQCPGVSTMLTTVLPTSVQSIPSEQGKHMPKDDSYLSARQTHVVAPGSEVS